MKKFKINALLLLGSLLGLSSCTSDLDVLPKDPTVFLSEDFFAQPGAYKQGLAGVYGNLSLTGTDGSGSSFLTGIDAGTSQFGRCLWYLQDLTTDEVLWSYENDPGTKELQRNIWTSKQTYIALGNLLNAAAELNIDVTPMEGFEPEKVNEILGLNERGLHASLIAPIGYRHADDATQSYAKVRKSEQELFINL